MSLEPRADEGVPEMTARVVRAAFPKGTLAIRIREALGPLFADEDFAAAFPRSGRPAASPGALALVSVLQFAEGLSDRQAADQVRARMDWKFLLGLELDDPGFDCTVLGDFRSRLIRHGLEEKVLEAVLERLSGAGLLRSGGRQRTDSTHVLASVRTLNRMEFVGETLRAALEALAAAAPGWLAPLIDAGWADRYGARAGSCRFPKGEETRARWLGQAGRDGFVDWDARKVTCPQGATSISWSDQRKPSGIPIARVHFALADCDACPLHPACTKAANGRYGRSLTLLSRDQHEVLARQRTEQQTPERKARYDVRAGVEGTISQAVRATRMRRTPYHGRPKTHLASVLNATALNLIRADAWLNGTPLGATHVSRLARLDLAA